MQHQAGISEPPKAILANTLNQNQHFGKPSYVARNIFMIHREKHSCDALISEFTKSPEERKSSHESMIMPQSCFGVLPAKILEQ